MVDGNSSGAKRNVLARDTSDGRHKLALRGKRTHDLSPSVTRVRFFMGVHQSECRQYPDIPSHGRPVSLENGSQFGNRRGILSHSVENTNPLRRQHPNQVGRIFKGQAHLRKQPCAAIQLLRTSRGSPEKRICSARPHPFETLNFLVHLSWGMSNMAVMAIMAVVVAEQPPVIHAADQMIDVREIVLRHFAIRHTSSRRLARRRGRFRMIVSSTTFSGDCRLSAFSALP